MHRTLVVLTISFAATTASAGPTKVSADKAKPLLGALKMAGVKPVHSGLKWTYNVQTIACAAHTETEDGLDAYDCQVDKHDVTGAAAMVLYDALTAVGVQESSGAGSSHLATAKLSCNDDQSAGDAATIYSCTLAAGGGADHP